MQKHVEKRITVAYSKGLHFHQLDISKEKSDIGKESSLWNKNCSTHNLLP